MSTIIQAITLALAVLGAVLGVINTWKALDRDRVKLRVIPKHAVPYGDIDPRMTFCIEITNLSGFAVTVEEAGVRFNGTSKRGAYVPPFLIDGLPWPRRLESRTSVTVYGQSPNSSGPHRLRCAYARTACGIEATGTSPAFEELAARS